MAKEDIITRAVRQGALQAIDKRITAHEARVVRETVTEYRDDGSSFVKGTPELTCAKRALVGALELRDIVATMDLSPPVNSA